MKIPVSHGELEAILKEPDTSPRGAAVVCHPHPLHGGTMHTKAVYRAAQALNEAGLLVLRFNFRGVGRSTGSYDEGVGEQEDLREVVDWLVAEHPEQPVVVGGFSFGSMVALNVGAADERAVALLGLGLPVDLEERYDFAVLAEADKPVLVVQAEEDEFGPASVVRETLQPLGSHITVVPISGTDHYFEGRLDELREVVRGYFETGPGSRVLATV
ncbi:MAG: alpha/beta fold hydrolase [Longimicrobiales bacterium]|nr:alpha/beta fold hydrolase [Longimicrobiales bacterium]